MRRVMYTYISTINATDLSGVMQIPKEYFNTQVKVAIEPIERQKNIQDNLVLENFKKA